MSHRSIGFLLLVMSGSPLFIPLAHASQLPITEDIPEEVLRAEIITEARSPIDGKPLSAIDFAELVVQVEQKTVQDDATASLQNSSIKNLLFLIRLRGFLKSVGIPLK
jgi:hypothetical protein